MKPYPVPSSVVSDLRISPKKAKCKNLRPFALAVTSYWLQVAAAAAAALCGWQDQVGNHFGISLEVVPLFRHSARHQPTLTVSQLTRQRWLLWMAGQVSNHLGISSTAVPLFSHSARHQPTLFDNSQSILTLSSKKTHPTPLYMTH